MRIGADAERRVDTDLAILGAVPRNAEYDRQVRTEYRWGPGFLYRHGRRCWPTSPRADRGTASRR